jgi:hypothetical protein
MIAEADRWRNEIMFFSKTHRVIYLRSREFTEKTGVHGDIDTFVACLGDEVKNLGTREFA